MHCIACQRSIDLTSEGFKVCAYCGSVNIGNQASSLASSIQMPMDSQPIVGIAESTSQIATGSQVARLIYRKKWLITGIVVGIVFVVGITGTGSVLAYENYHAWTYIKAATADISQGKYAEADVVLGKADHLIKFSRARRQLSRLHGQNNRYKVDQGELEQATKLVAEGKLDEADALLNKIDQDFPAYVLVSNIKKNILDQKAAIAEKATNVAAAQAKQASNTIATKKSTTKPAPASSGTFTTSSGAKRFVSTSASSSLSAAGTLSQAQQAVQSFLLQYGLNLVLSDSPPGGYTYNSVSESDLASFKQYSAVFMDEWSKYPTDWVANSGVKNIVIVKKLAISGTYRAAAPEPIGNSVYYDIGYGSGDYAREVIHHEYNHLITYHYFSSYSPSDPTWASYNPPGFGYGNGGASCYQANNSCLTGEHPVPGFVTGYAASAVEEDKAELYAYLMTGTYYHRLQGWIPGDSILNNKVNNYKQFIASHSSAMSGSYFNDIDP